MLSFLKPFFTPKANLRVLVAPFHNASLVGFDLFIPIENLSDAERALAIIEFSKRKKLPIESWELHIGSGFLGGLFPHLCSLRCASDVTIRVEPSQLRKFEGLAKRHRLECRFKTFDSTRTESMLQ